MNPKPRRFPDFDHIPPPPPPPGRPAQRAFVPQIRTFKDNEVPGGAHFLEDAVNTFSKDQHRLTGQTPILKPFPGGCTVIYWIPAEAPTGPVEGTATGWWPTRLQMPELKGPPPGHGFPGEIKGDGQPWSKPGGPIAL